MDDGDFQSTCRQFIEKFANKIDSLSHEECETPFRLVTFYLVSSEVEGECLEWIRRYLSLHDCPVALISQLTRTIYRKFEDYVNLSDFYLDPDDKQSDWEEDDDDEADGSQSSSDDDDDEDSHCFSPSQLDACKLLQTVVSYVHATIKSWNTSLPVLLTQPATMRIYSHAIKNTRRKMEDRHVIIPDLNVLYDLKDSPNQSYFAVFDGHGGLEAAEYAAAHLHGHLVSDQKFNNDPETAMKQAYITTDIKFLEKARREGLRSGTTGVSVLIRESELYVGWLGDSQALLVRSGQPVHLMSPHKPEREDERRRIEDLGGCVLFLGVWRVNGSISVSRAIGDSSFKPFVSSEADVSRISLNGEEEYLVLACDGLWDVLTPSQVISFVYRHSKSSPDGLSDIAVGLVNAAQDSGSSDNISVIVVLFKTSLSPPKAASGGGGVSFRFDQFSEKNLGNLDLSTSSSRSKPPTVKDKFYGSPHSKPPFVSDKSNRSLHSKPSTVRDKSIRSPHSKTSTVSDKSSGSPKPPTVSDKSIESPHSKPLTLSDKSSGSSHSKPSTLGDKSMGSPHSKPSTLSDKSSGSPHSKPSTLSDKPSGGPQSKVPTVDDKSDDKPHLKPSTVN